MLEHLLESSHHNDSNKWSNLGFVILEMKISTSSGVMKLGSYKCILINSFDETCSTNGFIQTRLLPSINDL